MYQPHHKTRNVEVATPKNLYLFIPYKIRAEPIHPSSFANGLVIWLLFFHLFSNVIFYILVLTTLICRKISNFSSSQKCDLPVMANANANQLQLKLPPSKESCNLFSKKAFLIYSCSLQCKCQVVLQVKCQDYCSSHIILSKRGNLKIPIRWGKSILRVRKKTIWRWLSIRSQNPKHLFS
jgi:hypothetical protein